MTQLIVRSRAFTLIEVMLATMIGAFVTLVAVGALTTVSRSVEAVQQTSDQKSESQSIMRLIRRDLHNIYRGADPRWTRFVGQDGNSQGGEGQPSLTFYSTWQGQVREGQAEGDLVEIEYFVRQSEKGSSLMRRIWPNPDPERKTGGGLLTLLGDQVLGFQIRYYDGKEWTNQWSEEKQQLPKLVEVSLIMGTQDEKKPRVASICVAFSRADGSEALRSIAQSQGRGNEGEGARP